MARTVVTYDAGTWDVAGVAPSSSPVTVTDSSLSTSDITTNNVTTAKHGFTPKLPNDATKFLDGTGAYTVPPGTGAVSSVFGRTGAVVATTNDYTEAQLSFSDITTNNVSTSKHGYAPKLSNVATQYLDGTGAFSVPAGSGMSSKDVVTRSTDLTVTATTAAGAQDWIIGNAVTYNGTTAVVIEAFLPFVNATGAALVIVELYDGVTDLGELGQFGTSQSAYCATVLTPSAASHTYHIKAWRTGSNRTIAAGAASPSGVFVDAFYRITTA